MLKWIVRVVGGLVALAVVVTIALMIWYSHWIADYKREIVSGSQIATTALGEIEYARAGEGIPILRIHGRPGGYDVAIVGPRSRPAEYAGLQTIAVSRPGYLRTPLRSGQTPAEQADLYAALLDSLGIRRALIYGTSGGGPSAMQFAIRHPNRTIGLILVVPDLEQSTGASERSTTPGPVKMFLQDFAFWLGGQVLVKQLGPMMMHGLDREDPLATDRMQEMGRAFLASDLRVAGNENDVSQYKTLAIESWPLEKMSVPALILHGNADKNAAYEASARAAARIPNAKLIKIEGGEHTMIISRARELSGHVNRFITTLLQ